MSLVPTVPPRTSWPAVFALALAVFMTALDTTVVSTALPVMSAAFAVDPVQAQWILLAYTLPMVALLLPAGRWVGGAGVRQAFVLAVAGFAATSALIALAPTFTGLLAGRALQGVFGAHLAVMTLRVANGVVRPPTGAGGR